MLMKLDDAYNTNAVDILISCSFVLPEYFVGL
jgi:hypothetical protein